MKKDQKSGWQHKPVVPQSHHLGGWGSMIRSQGLPKRYKSKRKELGHTVELVIPRSLRPSVQGNHGEQQSGSWLMLYNSHLTDIRGNFCLEAKLRLCVLRPFLVSPCDSAADTPVSPGYCWEPVTSLLTILTANHTTPESDLLPWVLSGKTDSHHAKMGIGVGVGFRVHGVLNILCHTDSNIGEYWSTWKPLCRKTFREGSMGARDQSQIAPSVPPHRVMKKWDEKLGGWHPTLYLPHSESWSRKNMGSWPV